MRYSSHFILASPKGCSPTSGELRPERAQGEEGLLSEHKAAMGEH